MGKGCSLAKGELVDSDINTSCYSSDSGFESSSIHSEDESDLLKKYNLSHTKSFLRNSADNLLSNPKYQGKRTNITDLDLPAISSSDDEFTFGSILGEDEDGGGGGSLEEEDGGDIENNATDCIFQQYQKLQSEEKSSSTAIQLLSSNNSEADKAEHLRKQLGLIDKLFTLRILLQSPFSEALPKSSKLSAKIIEIISLLLSIQEKPPCSSTTYELDGVEMVWDAIKSVSMKNEEKLMQDYDELWTKSHLTFQRKGSRKELQILNQGFSASIQQAVRPNLGPKQRSLAEEDFKFYQQFLKDIIDLKLSSSTQAHRENQSLSMALAATKKKKNQVHSSKGKKLSFEAHPKLESFMAPKRLHSEWSEERINQLFHSLPPLIL